MDLGNTQNDDESLLEKFQNGDSTAFERLVERHAPKASRIAQRMLFNRAEAEDIVQNAFLKLWQRPHLCDARRGGGFAPWFYRIVVNACHDSNRRYRSVPFDAEAMDRQGFASHAGTREQAERRAILRDWITQLPARQKTALTLCFYEGFSNEEAAKIMGLGLKAFQSLVMRAKESLKLGAKDFI